MKLSDEHTSKRTGKHYYKYGTHYWTTYVKAAQDTPGSKLSNLGIMLDKMLNNPDEWIVCLSYRRKIVLRHPRGDIGLDVTYKHCFDVEGRAVLTLDDRETLWPKVADIVSKQTGIPYLEFDNRCTEQTRARNRKKYFNEIMASIMEIDGGSQKTK